MDDNNKENIQKHIEEIEEDYKLTRLTYHTLLNSNLEMLPSIKDMCEDSEHPRMVEVYSKFAKETADIADKLIENHRKKQIVDTESVMNMISNNEENAPMLTATVVREERFVGTTEDMQKRIQERLKKETEDNNEDEDV